jgi:hypothetical protein
MKPKQAALLLLLLSLTLSFMHINAVKPVRHESSKTTSANRKTEEGEDDETDDIFDMQGADKLDDDDDDDGENNGPEKSDAKTGVNPKDNRGASSSLPSASPAAPGSPKEKQNALDTSKISPQHTPSSTQSSEAGAGSPGASSPSSGTSNQPPSSSSQPVASGDNAAISPPGETSSTSGEPREKTKEEEMEDKYNSILMEYEEMTKEDLPPKEFVKFYKKTFKQRGCVDATSCLSQLHTDVTSSLFVMDELGQFYRYNKSKMEKLAKIKEYFKSVRHFAVVLVYTKNHARGRFSLSLLSVALPLFGIIVTCLF